MGLWNFLGGNQIGPGHPRYERQLRKAREYEALTIRLACGAIMRRGISQALKYEEEDVIIYVLEKYPRCPKISDERGKVYIGHREQDINNWRQAQQWLQLIYWWENKDISSYKSEYLALLKYFNEEAKVNVANAEKEYETIIKNNETARWYNKWTKGDHEREKRKIRGLKREEEKANKALTELEDWLLKNPKPENTEYVKYLEQKIQKLEQDVKKMEEVIEKIQLIDEPEK